MTVLRIVLFVLIVGILLLVLMGQAGLLEGRPRGELGVKDGKLQRPSRSENSVSSQAVLWPDHPMRSYAQVDPLRIPGPRAVALKKLRATLEGMPRMRVVSAEDNYIYAQHSTAMLRFVDDVEFFYSEPESVVHVRSASRLGRKDFGTNRKRVEAIRTALAAN
jgi:uncharacterized protein (DUF1499 family)